MTETCDCLLCRHPARVAFTWWQEAKEATSPLWTGEDLERWRFEELLADVDIELEPAISRSNVALSQPAHLVPARVA